MNKNWDWKEAHKDLPELPADFTEYALDMFEGDHTLYYHGRGVHKDVICPVCRHTEHFGYRTQIYPKSGLKGRCSSCGRTGTYSHALRVTRPTIRECFLFIGQKFRENDFVLRGFKVILIERNPLSIIDNEEEPMEIRLSEKRRLYITKDGFEKEYFHPDWEYCYATASGYHGGWIEKDRGGYWTNTAGENYNKYKMYVYPGIIEDSVGTVAEYSMIEELFGKDPEAEIALPIPKYTYYGQTYLTIWDYYCAYAKDRKLEILFKCGLSNIATAKLAGSAIHYNPRAKNPWDYLKVTKERLKWMCKHNPGIRMLELCRYERKNGLRLDDDTCNNIGAAGINTTEFEHFLHYMTPKQLSNRLLKYTGKLDSLRTTAILYRDYLQMREALGYDMTNSIYTYPRNLKAEHDKLVIEQNERKAEERKKTVEKKYKKIRDRYKEAAAVYGFTERGLTIRPAKNASEIIDEGRKLHHCVGGDNYLTKHANRVTIILFLRSSKAPEIPYITVEATPTGDIKQWYGIHDTKPDKKKIERFLKDYCKQLDLKALAKEAKLKICATERVAI